MNEIQGREEESENPYLVMDFWHFAIVSTLMVVFFRGLCCSVYFFMG